MKIKELFLVPLSFFAASLAQAQQGGLVPCGGEGDPCGYNDLLTLADNVISFALFYVALPAGVLIIMWGGFLILTARENAGQVNQGKKLIEAVFWGIVMAFGAWMIVRVIINLVS